MENFHVGNFLDIGKSEIYGNFELLLDFFTWDFPVCMKPLNISSWVFWDIFSWDILEFFPKHFQNFPRKNSKTENFPPGSKNNFQCNFHKMVRNFLNIFHTFLKH